MRTNASIDEVNHYNVYEQDDASVITYAIKSGWK